MKSQTVDTKLIWIKKLRELIQENTYFSSRLSTLNLTASKLHNNTQKHFKESSLLNISNIEQSAVDANSLNNKADRNSIASHSSSNTTDSDKFYQR